MKKRHFVLPEMVLATFQVQENLIECKEKMVSFSVRPRKKRKREMDRSEADRWLRRVGDQPRRIRSPSCLKLLTMLSSSPDDGRHQHLACLLPTTVVTNNNTHSSMNKTTAATKNKNYNSIDTSTTTTTSTITTNDSNDIK